MAAESRPYGAQDEPFPLRDVDFDAVYRGESGIGGMDFGGEVPWDIGGAQPAVVEFEADGRICGDVLDAGCGLGDNAIFLAGKGYRVTGVDGAPYAIERARRRAAAHGVEVEFAVADATALTGYEGRFDTVVDSALYHCFDPEHRRLYAAALYRVTRPGARLNLLCFSDELTAGMPGPSGVPADEIRGPLTGAGWTDVELRRRTIAGRPPTPAAIEAAARLAEAGHPGTVPDFDDQGRVLLPAWSVTARRA